MPPLIPLLLTAATAAMAATTAAADPLTPVQVTPPPGEGTPRTYQVEVAATPAQRRRGLSHRRTLPAQGGMLFIFTPPKKQVCFWMKDTHIPLAALFADADHTIVTVALMQPNTTDHHCSDTTTPIKYVLELHQEEAQNLPPNSTLKLPEVPPE